MTKPSNDRPNLLLLQILADYSNDLHTLSKRDGKTPAAAAVERIEELFRGVTNKSINDDELREKLAAIEHERWADWQRWCHQILRGNNPSPEIGDVLERWDRQIETSYAELSDKEKASDMEQVDRYWPLIEEYITAHRNILLDDLLRELEDKRRDIEANFDITEDGGIDHPDTESGHEHALQFADWTGYNLALSEFKQIIEGKKHD